MSKKRQSFFRVTREGGCSYCILGDPLPRWRGRAIDERNAIVALQAKRLGIERVIAIARDPDYVTLMEDSGIACISAPYATAAMVENYLERPQVADLFEIEIGVASLIDMEVPEGSPVEGQEIQDIDIPVQCVVAAVIRDDTFVVPRGKTEIRAGDEVVFIGPSDAIQTAHDIFSEEADTTA